MLSYLYPNKCVACGSIITDSGFLCTDCLPAMHAVGNDRCKYCGRERMFCLCNGKDFFFKRNVAVFRYEEGAQKIVKRYKFGKVTQLAVYISRRMSMMIYDEYKDIKFDVICFVPSSVIRKIKRGFNPAGLIAQKISKELNVPLKPYVKRKIGLGQQKSRSYTQRIENVKNKFYVKEDLTGKTVLLIDDVITTGATLNECSRALNNAGSKNVYCATFAATYKK